MVRVLIFCDDGDDGDDDDDVDDDECLSLNAPEREKGKLGTCFVVFVLFSSPPLSTPLHTSTPLFSTLPVQPQRRLGLLEDKPRDARARCHLEQVGEHAWFFFLLFEF